MTAFQYAAGACFIGLGLVVALTRFGVRLTPYRRNRHPAGVRWYGAGIVAAGMTGVILSTCHLLLPQTDRAAVDTIAEVACAGVTGACWLVGGILAERARSGVGQQQAGPRRAHPGDEPVS
jgi:hypothetical protein